MDNFCAVSCLQDIVQEAVRRRASDIHVRFEPDALLVDLRVDGHISCLQTISHADRYQLVAHIKSLALLDVAQRRCAQDGKILWGSGQKAIDIRVATMPAQWAEAVCLRLLYPEHARLNLVELGCAAEHITALQGALEPPQGLVLVTGPTGSGKSTTLRALTNYLDSARFRVVTLEDPIEYTMAGITQCQLAPELGFDAAQGLKAVLRQDPDVVVIGEIRDTATARVALQAALTGHLVLSTLHTPDAPATIIRLLDMGIPPYLVTAALRCVVSQRLVRTVCASCVGSGCIRCQETGIHGRRGVFEVLPITPSIQQAIRDEGTYQGLYATARQEGYRTWYEHAQELATQGLVRDGEPALLGVSLTECQ